MISQEWFEQAYQRSAKKLCIISYNVVGDEDIASEVVHNVFLSVWERREVVKLEGDIEHYLFRAVKLASLEYLRTKIIREKHLGHLAFQQQREVNTTEEQLAFYELRDRISLLASDLPPQSREVFTLSREKGLSNRAIAVSLNISDKTVEAHISKALKYLRDHLSDYRL